MQGTGKHPLYFTSVFNTIRFGHSSRTVKVILGLGFALWQSMGINSASAAAYEDFSDSAIDCYKHSEIGGNGVSGYGVSDRQVYTASGKVHQVVRPYSSATGESTCRSKLRFPSGVGSSISSIAGTVRLEQINFVPGMLYTGTDMSGIFYNINTVAPVDSAGDIFARIMFGERGNGLEAWWQIWESLGSGFNMSALVDEGQINAGVPALSTDYPMSISYDGAKTFTFMFNNVSVNGDGPARVGNAYHGSERRLATRVWMTSAVTGDASANAIHAVYDDIKINGNTTAYDDFSSGIRDSKWSLEGARGEFKRTVSSGEMMLQGKSSEVDARGQALLDVPLTNYLQADLKLKGGITPVDARARLRVQGGFGNTKYASGYNGKDGDLFIMALLEKRDDSNDYRAVAYAEFADDPTWSTYVSLFWQEFNMSILPDHYYTISIFQQGKVFTFTLRDTVTGVTEIVRKNIGNAADLEPGTPPVANLYAPNPDTSGRNVLARVDKVSSVPAEIIAYVDNIYVIDPNAVEILDFLPGIIAGANN